MVLHNMYADDKFAQEFGINVSSDLVNVPAHLLPAPLVTLLSSFFFLCKNISVDESRYVLLFGE